MGKQAKINDQENPQSVHSSSEDQNEQGEEEEDYEEEDPYEDIDQNEEHQALLRCICEKIQQAKSDAEKLSWGAIYSLQEEQNKIRLEKQKEYQAIQAKFNKKKQQLVQKIALVVGGKKLKNQLYINSTLTKNLNPNKTKPVKISSFWSNIFVQGGIITDDCDIQFVNNVSLLTCETKDEQISIIFEFQNETSYFSNKKLSVKLKKNGDQVQKKVQQKIIYKKQKIQTSLFSILFDQQSDKEQAYSIGMGLYDLYLNPIYNYFFKKIQNQCANQGNQNGINQSEQQQQSEEQDQSQQQAAPKKKIKTNISKPQCPPQ